MRGAVSKALVYVHAGHRLKVYLVPPDDMVHGSRTTISWETLRFAYGVIVVNTRFGVEGDDVSGKLRVPIGGVGGEIWAQQASHEIKIELTGEDTAGLTRADACEFIDADSGSVFFVKTGQIAEETESR